MTIAYAFYIIFISRRNASVFSVETLLILPIDTISWIKVPEWGDSDQHSRWQKVNKNTFSSTGFTYFSFPHLLLKLGYTHLHSTLCHYVEIKLHTMPGSPSTSMWVIRDNFTFPQHNSHVWWGIGVSRKLSPGNYCTVGKISGEFAKKTKWNVLHQQWYLSSLFTQWSNN